MKNYQSYCAVLFLLAWLLMAPYASAQKPEKSPTQSPRVIGKSSSGLQQSAVKRALPAYPAAAKAQGRSGEVLIEIKVDKDGKVMATTPVLGDQLLAEAAMQALREWEFVPTQIAGVAVKVIGVIGFVFTKDGRVIEKAPSAPAGFVGAEAAGNMGSVETAPPVVSENERTDLLQKLHNAYDISLRRNNPENVVLEITKATIKAVRRDEKDLATTAETAGYAADFAMQATIEIQNETTKVITGAGFKFTNVETRQVFFSYPNLLPVNSLESQQIHYELMILSGNPASLQVELVGVKFADGKTAGAFPGHPQVGLTAPPPDNPKVDAKPRPLNRLRPNYSADARRNKITGAVRLQLKVGAEGAVKSVQVLNALPDGLTEEAIRIARVLQFQPAMSKGVPVEYAIVIEVEFDWR
ncbi:MAG: TonB family protein [Acidobacteria bacterium]|nr:TonB family protein [Acidobacteriota bacterium]